MASSQAARTKVFISYSHADKEWLERLKRHLKPLERGGYLDCWDDTHIQPGDDWKKEIRTALDGAQVAVLLISADFFASEFINETELPPLLAAAQAKGVRILPVILSASRFARDPSLARFQAVNPPERPLNDMPPAEQEKVLDRLADTIERTLTARLRRSDVSARPTDSNRYQMLAEVRRVWIDGYLKHSLVNLASIELGLEETPDAVSRPWDLIVQPANQAPRPLPPGQAMGTVFDEFGQALLILGAPGSGKTTLLLELARDLLDRAEQDATHRIPVVFHLSSWAVRRRPLADWLIEGLTERYYVPRKLAQAWTDAEQVLPLLDSLDEVASEYRAACVEAINTFRRRYPRVPLVVCSRAADYEALPVRVELSGAVVIEPLSRVQVSSYLKQTGKSLAGVRTVLRDDQTLWELLETPLMLSIVALAYHGRSAAEVRATGSLEQRRTHLFENYTRRMFERRTKVTAYTREQTLHWLTWLARSLMRNNLSLFYVERMQPDWLPSRVQRSIVAMVPILIFGLAYELAVGLIFELHRVVIQLELMQIFGPTFGVLGALAVGLIFGRAGRLDRITPAEALRWSWREAQNSWVSGLIFGSVIGATFGVLGALLDMVLGAPRGGLLDALVFGLVFGLVVALVRGFTADQIVTRAIPNEGIRRSLQNALISLLIGGLVIGLVVALVFGLIHGVVIQLGLGLGLGLELGLFGGMIIGLRNGGFAYLQHYVLRFLLWRNDYAPWSYIRFLDYAAARVFLRKVGGGYIFTHRLLMEYFATLQPTDRARQTQTA